MARFKNKFLSLTLLSLFSCLPGAWAAERIVNVDFEGLSRTSEVVLRQKVSSIEGTAYSAQAINQDIKKLYSTGYFADVFVEKITLDGGVRVVFHVKEKGLVGSILILGNKKIKDKDIEEVLTIHKDNLLEEGKLAESLQAIRDLYEKKGYSLAEVRSEINPLDTKANELEVIIRVNEYSDVRIRRISFVGNHVYSDKKLAGLLHTKVKGPLSFVTSSGKYKEEKFKHEQELLQYFYMSNGYLKVTIGDPDVALTKDKKSLLINFRLHEGAAYKVSQVDIDGDILTTKEELVSKLKMKSGQVFDIRVQKEDADYLKGVYGDQGYAYAAINPDIQTDDEAKTATLTYHVSKGRRIYINRILIKGNDVTRDKVIRREMQIKENSLYNQTAINNSERRLYQLGYFESVNIQTPNAAGGDDRVDIVVEVKEKQTGSFNLGAGFSTLESFIFTAAVQKSNFMGLGLEGSVSANISKLRQEFNLSMSDRYFLDTRWIVNLNIFKFSSALNRDFDQSSTGGSLTFGREVFPFFDVNLGYNINDVNIHNFSSQVPVFFQRNASGLTSSVISSVGYDTRDNRLYTTKGVFSSFTSEYAGHGVGGDNDFWKMSVDSRFFLKMPLKTLIKARGSFSYVNSLSSKPVPLFERYFMGGINTLRGFDLNTIGPQIRVPKTVTGGDHLFTFGGNRMVLFNTEYELPLYDPAGFKAVVFMDFGQAFAEDESIDITSIRADYGFGVRWASPFGPLRFEWGFPIDKRSGESSSVFNFTIGQSF